MLTVGAVHWNSATTIESYSSQGPTIDGRLKPEIVGNACANMVSTGAPFCGTSQASPYVAGLVALVQQRFPELTPVEVVAYLESNAISVGQETPNMVWGYGRATLPTDVANAP
jgi:subtilisin family serine protease